MCLVLNMEARALILLDHALLLVIVVVKSDVNLGVFGSV